MTNKLVLVASYLIFTTAVIILMTSEGSSGAKQGGHNPPGYACAACKLQRRRCSPDCVLRPYFPANRAAELESAHRLFGICKIEKLLKPLDQNIQEEAAKSIIYESTTRSRSPVHGSYGVICELRNRCQLLNDELLRLRSLNAQYESAIAAASAAATSLNLTLNNNYFSGISNGTNDLFPGGGYCGNFAYGGGVCGTETMPLENPNANACLPDLNDPRLCPVNENANDNNNNNQTDDVNNENAIDDFDQGLEQFLGVPPPATPTPNNDNEIQCDDDDDDIVLPDDTTIDEIQAFLKQWKD